MSHRLGPLDREGRVPAQQQTRVAAFLLSAHGAHARRLAIAVPSQLHAGWQVDLHAQFCREMEILSLLARATSWVPDPMLIPLMLQWEAAWLPQPVEGVEDMALGALIDLAAFGHALHAAIRPAKLLPERSAPSDPFVLALQRIELESARLIQAQILFLKSMDLQAVHDAIDAAVGRRHGQVRALWSAMLRGIGA